MHGDLTRARPRIGARGDRALTLHRLDENRAGDISGLLGFLRQMQREHDCAVIVAHHFAKRVGAELGQALRGSGDLHAWGDSNAYLTRTRGQLRLTVEHRAAPQTDPLILALRTDDGPARLELLDSAPAAQHAEPDLHELVLDALAKASGPLTRNQLRDQLRIRNQRLGQTLDALCAEGRARRTGAGWTTADTPITPRSSRRRQPTTDAQPRLL
jgi:hypothetical protein